MSLCLKLNSKRYDPNKVIIAFYEKFQNVSFKEKSIELCLKMTKFKGFHVVVVGIIDYYYY